MPLITLKYTHLCIGIYIHFSLSSWEIKHKPLLALKLRFQLVYPNIVLIIVELSFAPQKPQGGNLSLPLDPEQTNIYLLRLKGLGLFSPLSFPKALFMTTSCLRSGVLTVANPVIHLP